VTPDERRLVVLALLLRREFGAASPESVVSRMCLGRVEGYATLARLERHGLVERDPVEGVVVSFNGRMMAGL
jgi:hypothetical protein